MSSPCAGSRASGRRSGASAARPSVLGRRRSVPQREVLLFNQELAALLRAGLPLAESLAIMVERMDNEALRKAVEQILAEVRAGAPMSEAVTRHRFFPAVYPACLKAGRRAATSPGCWPASPPRCGWR